MARPRKTSFYHTRWNRCGLNQERAAEVLGTSVDMVKSWDKEGNELAERYLLLWDKKNINVEGWQGWLFSRGVLRHGNKQWRPENILAARDQAARIEELQREIEKQSSIKGKLKAIISW